jgi:hypothetical protein
MALPDQHLAYMLKHQVALTGRGVVVWRGITLDATVDTSASAVNDLAAVGFQAEESDIVLRCQWSALPAGAVRGDALTVDDVNRRVRHIFPQGDGLEALVVVASSDR